MIASAFARLPTGIKMLLILSAALLPLGIIALLASVESAHTQRLDREAQARIMASDSARQLSGTISRMALALRRAGSTLPPSGPGREEACLRLIHEARLLQRHPARLGLFESTGRKICADERMSPAAVVAPPMSPGAEVRLIAPREGLRLTVQVAGGLIGVGEFPTEALASLTHPPAPVGSYRLVLRQGDARLWIANHARGSALGERISASSPVAGGQLSLELTVISLPVTAIGILLGLLPILMWLAAALIGWLVVDRLLLKPLAQMQRAITDYKVEDGPMRLPALTTPAQEIRALGKAFEAVTSQLAAHDAELEEGLARQRRLTREVHHRVKNNLQVVSSLINLHARGVTTPETVAAYASIQRRVDALAVVHRNHYAELEENRGVGLRPLIGELASNLRATADPAASHLSITLDIAPVFASQDVAVPVSFLITELVELVMICAPSSRIAIRVEVLPDSPRALLSVTAAALGSEACIEHPSAVRFNRVIEGLSRQLRSKLQRDETGRYSIEIGILGKDEN